MREAELSYAHDKDFVRRALQLSLTASEERRIGMRMTKALAYRARLTAGGTYLAAKCALDFGIACQTAGDSHHSHKGFGSGYCLFNDVAVAVQMLRAEGLCERVLILDLDVHQGDGTAAIFNDEPNVFTFSMHADKNFPTRKIPGDLDIALDDGTGDHTYLNIVKKTVPHLIATHLPQIVFYNAGVDPHRDDQLGRLGLSDEGIARRDALVVDACHMANVPLVTVLGGGYSADSRTLAQLHLHVIKAAARKFGLLLD